MQPDAKRLRDAHDGLEARVRGGLQRLVQALAPQARALRDLRHALSTGDFAECTNEHRRLSRHERSIDELRYQLLGVEELGRIEGGVIQNSLNRRPACSA